MLKCCQIPKKLPRKIHSRKAYQKYLSSNVSLSPYSPCDSWFVLCWCGSWFIESFYLAFHRIWRSWFKLRTQNQDVTNASSHHPGRSTWSPFSYKSCHLQIVWSLAKQRTTEHLLCFGNFHLKHTFFVRSLPVQSAEANARSTKSTEMHDDFGKHQDILQ